MNLILKHTIRFLFFALAQVLILNQIEIGYGIQLMIYPLFIFLLPVEMSIIVLMILAFVIGLTIDALSNTYGLHASSLLVFAYARPFIFKIFAPRDGYDVLQETNIFVMSNSWFLKTFGILLAIHHLWFFSLEMFKLNDFVFILQKTLLSLPLSLIICLLLQYLFLKKTNEK